LVGRLGPAATVHYYQRLLATCDQRGWVARVVITRADVRRVLAAAADGDLKGMAVHLAGKLAELDRTRAEVRAIGAVTPHMCMPELAQLTRSPLLDPIDVLNEELTRTGIERVALMGARATVSGRLFGRLRAGIVDPSPDQLDHIHDPYLSIVQTGQVGPDTAAALGGLAREMTRDLQVQAIILAGTELALVSADTWCEVRTIDCARLYIEAIVGAAAPVRSP